MEIVPHDQKKRLIFSDRLPTYLIIIVISAISAEAEHMHGWLDRPQSNTISGQCLKTLQDK